MPKQNISQQNIWLNIDKPIGYSSAKVVAIVKRLTGAKRVGHAGTLDPFASGVLPIALNKATKSCQYIVDDHKKYFFRITWGEFRDSDDVEGKVTQLSEARPSTEQLISALPQLMGTIKQVPSRFSAIKINGVRAYSLARKDVDFDIKQREVTIFSAKLIGNNSEFADFEIACSKGTYVRSFARDLSEKVNVCGYVSILTRLKVGNFLHNKTISLAKLKSLVNYGGRFFDGSLLSLHDVLSFMIEIKLDDLDASRFKHGQIIQIDSFTSDNFISDSLAESHHASCGSRANRVRVVNNGELIGLGELIKNELKPVNVFN